MIDNQTEKLSDTEQHLIRRVAADPDNDLPRLVLADYYQEQGHPLGTLIKSQCEMERLDWDDERYVALEDCVEKLLEQHRNDLLKRACAHEPKLRGIVAGSGGFWPYGRCYFRRGFVEEYSVYDNDMLNTHLEALKRYGLARYLTLQANPLVMFSPRPNAKSIKLLSNCDFLRGVALREFEGKVDLAKFKRFKSRDKLRSLAVTEGALDEKSIRRISRLNLPNLRELNLFYNALGDLGVEALYAWPCARNLRGLNLARTSFGRLGELAQQRSLKDLFALNVSGNRIAFRDFEEFAKRATMKRLTKLMVSSNPIQDEGLISLVSGGFRELRLLGLSDTGVTDDAIESLASSANMANLELLDISNNPAIGDRSLVSIAGSTHLRKLAHLDLEGTNFGEVGMRALIDSDSLNSIRSLNLGKKEIKKTTLKALHRRYPRAVGVSWIMPDT